MTDQELQKLCRKWQKRLRLQDWDVKVRIARARDFTKGDCQGECEFVLATKRAFIRILDPVDYDPDFVWQQDMEETLVHELLHLHFGPFDVIPNNANYIAGEQAISAIAKAMVDLARNES